MCFAVSAVVVAGTKIHDFRALPKTRIKPHFADFYAFLTIFFNKMSDKLVFLYSQFCVNFRGVTLTTCTGVPFNVRYKALSHLLLISDYLKQKYLTFTNQRGSHSPTSVKRKGDLLFVRKYLFAVSAESWKRGYDPAHPGLFAASPFASTVCWCVSRAIWTCFRICAVTVLCCSFHRESFRIKYYSALGNSA